jgi:kinesin family protein 1
MSSFLLNYATHSLTHPHHSFTHSLTRSLTHSHTHSLTHTHTHSHSHTTGVYVEGLTPVAVLSYSEIQERMEEGTRNRTIGSTKMNATSSRAHTVFGIRFTTVKHVDETDMDSEMTASMNLVDLAGSERQGSTGAEGDRLKEGCAINQSLSALGNVISSLADKAMGKKKVFIPYRNSALTFLLQDALGGNSKTIMIAALSPADVNYEETLSTLRYADRAKKIKNKAVKMENPTDRIIRMLKEENARLKKMLGGKGNLKAMMSAMDKKADAGKEVDAKTQKLLSMQKQVCICVCMCVCVYMCE